MNIIDIYNKYYLPESLQLHMLRVAACARLILDNWTGPEINKDSIIRICLLHDLGNILKIPEDYTDDKNFKRIRKKYIEEYGHDDYRLNLDLGREEGLSEYELILSEGESVTDSAMIKIEEPYERKIYAYCDERVSPNGVLSLIDRLEDVKIRYKDKPWSIWSDNEYANKLINNAIRIENNIMNYIKIKPEDINDNSISKYIDELKEYVIIKK